MASIVFLGMSVGGIISNYLTNSHGFGAPRSLRTSKALYVLNQQAGDLLLRPKSCTSWSTGVLPMSVWQTTTHMTSGFRASLPHCRKSARFHSKRSD